MNPKLYRTGRDRLAYRPVWMQNFFDMWFAAANVDEKIGLMLFYAPLGLRWLNRVRVSDDPAAQRAALACFRVLNRFAVWNHLHEPYGALREIVQLNKRLRGLVVDEGKTSHLALPRR